MVEAQLKILLYGESPIPETGAARVNRHLLETIVELGIEVEVLGTSHFWGDEYNHEQYPYKIVPVEGGNALETHKRAGDMIAERDGTFDLLFISADMHVPQILNTHLKTYPSIVLGAIDGPVYFAEQISSFREAMIPAVYSKYSYSQVLGVLPEIKDRFRCTPLGCEPDVFFPISEEERREYRKRAFGIGDETFLVMWANRNQMRKDPARAMKAFHLFHERVPDSRLYMHCRVQDVGGNLVSQARLLGLDVVNEVIFTPPEYTEIAGFERWKLNLMYNAADVGISTAQGEGWGLTTSEFMSAGTPFIGPANTTFWELLGGEPGYYWKTADRGFLVESGGDNLWSIYYGVDDASRPLTSCTDLADELYYVYTHRVQAKAKAKHARWWAEKHTWQGFKESWKEILQQCQERLSPEL